MKSNKGTLFLKCNNTYYLWEKGKIYSCADYNKSTDHAEVILDEKIPTQSWGRFTKATYVDYRLSLDSEYNILYYAKFQHTYKSDGNYCIYPVVGKGDSCLNLDIDKWNISSVDKHLEYFDGHKIKLHRSFGFDMYEESKDEYICDLWIEHARLCKMNNIEYYE